MEEGAPSVPTSTVSRYVVLEEVGWGGMGRVLRAYDPKLQREVALKQVHRNALSEQAMLQLVAEARAMATLSHPSVVAVFDVEVDTDSDLPGEVVLVMEYVRAPPCGSGSEMVSTGGGRSSTVSSRRVGASAPPTKRGCCIGRKAIAWYALPCPFRSDLGQHGAPSGKAGGSAGATTIGLFPRRKHSTRGRKATGTISSSIRWATTNYRSRSEQRQ